MLSGRGRGRVEGGHEAEKPHGQGGGAEVEMGVARGRQETGKSRDWRTESARELVGWALEI